MSALTLRRTGARALVDALRVHGVDTIFCVPGESYLAVLDALHDVADEIRLIVCRHEGGAANMADAYGKLTGRPGICFVTRGPGAFNASVGVHTAFQDSTPMILFMGQVGRSDFEREAFQEIDVRKVFGATAKWAAQIDDPDRVPEMVSRAFHTAVNGRPGPVVIALPEDMLTAETEAADTGPYQRVASHPGAGDMERLRRMLEEAERPFLLVGGPGWSEAAKADLEAFAAANHLPVGTQFRRQDHFDNDHPCYVGDVGIAINPALAEMIRAADLLVAVGPRLGEMTTSGYSIVRPPEPAQKLVHVLPGAEELGRVYRPALPILASPEAFAAAARRMAPVEPRWSAWIDRGRAAYEEWQKPDPNPGPVQMGEIMRWLRDRLPADAIVCNGAGNYAGWVHRFHRFRRFGTQLAPTSGAMGYGVPAAVAAKLRHPDRTVVCFAGDGCFLMTGQELATACQYDLPILVIVVNNGMYGTIRMHQEREYPGRVSGTGLANPDFAALARAYGGHGETVVETAAFAPAFERALASGRPAVIEIRLDPEAITTRTTLSAIRETARARQAG
mgnify:CR=1 FL=1